jgi:hypothetical protein
MDTSWDIAITISEKFPYIISVEQKADHAAC